MRHGTLKKRSFCTNGYAEIHIQRPFFDIEKGIWKFLVLKIQTVYMLWCPLYTWKKNQSLNFW
jgi:hypothetical protein